jgi:transcriptional regulator with XRE-family HTH domain
MDIGKQIAKYRKEKNITQEQLGETVGVTNRTVSKWEQGVSLPGIDLVPRIASTLGISLDQLFGTNTEKQSTDLSQTVKEAISAAFEDYLYDAIDDAISESLPKYLNDYQSEGVYSLLILDRGKTRVSRFRGQGTVQGPFSSFGNKYGIIIPCPGGNESAGYYDTKEEASAALEAIFKAYSQKKESIELL